MAQKSYFEASVLIREFLREDLFEDSCFCNDEVSSLENKIKQVPSMHQKNFLGFKNQLFSYYDLLKIEQSCQKQSKVLENPKNDKIVRLVLSIFAEVGRNSKKDKLFTKLGDAVYPYYEIINFIGQLLLFLPRSSSELVWDDIRDLKILNILLKL